MEAGSIARARLPLPLRDPGPSPLTTPSPHRAPAGAQRLLAQGADPSPRGAVTRGEGRRVPATSTPPLPLREVRCDVGARAEDLVIPPPPARGPDLIIAPHRTPAPTIP